MDPPAVTESGFGANHTDMGYNNNFSEPTRLPYNRSAEQGAVSERASVIIAISITALYSAICVLGLLGNVLVMYGVIRYTKMNTATNIYIFNLALADALATSTLPFQSAKYLMRTWPFGELLCKIIIAIDYYNMFTSIFTLTMMSVDRYIAVCHPVRALEFRTPVKAKIINICIWILSSAIGIPVMIIAVTRDTENGKTICRLKFPDPERYYDSAIKICVFIVAFVVPVLVISVCYGLMILRLKSVRLLSGSKEKDKNLRRITRMVLVVVAAFIICWTPIHIFIIVKTFIEIDQKNPLMIISWHLCIALGYMNSSLNPVLYAFLDENFKRCFREFCLPFCSHMEQNSFSRAKNTTREPVSVCGTTESVRKPT
ncbi:opioid receptor, delta 1b isoform X1 [Tachysurus vachellii]|uniref:opioid receptor, delta 1b isoform X1 n=1 Tax=Tachysurus vachellii TaxID=175792 RepID=UPI00296B44D8|nr:opioid receptor, delta 1b isoform X1 [Tachysurus vachellii]